MTLPVNVDATYDDNPTRPDVKDHQLHHDEGHRRLNDLKSVLTTDAVNGRVGLAGNVAPSVPVDVGTGDGQGMYAVATPTRLSVRIGTAAAPDSASGPTVKVSRTFQVTRAALDAVAGAGSDGGDFLASIQGVAVGTAANEVQPVGVYGAAKNAGTAGPTVDACGLYGVGRALTGSVGTGIGGFLLGRRDSSSGRAMALELHVHNGGTAVAYSPAGFTNSQALWINAGGLADSASAITVSNSFGRQFENGLSFTAQVKGGKTGGAKTASIRDDGEAATSLLINGTHATAAIAVAPNAGKVGVGIVAPVSLLHVSGGDAEISGSGVGLILTAPNNSRWRTAVDNDGRISTTAVV